MVLSFKSKVSTMYRFLYLAFRIQHISNVVILWNCLLIPNAWIERNISLLSGKQVSLIISYKLKRQLQIGSK